VPVDPVDQVDPEPTEPLVDPEQPIVLDKVKVEEEGSKVFGLPTLTFILILVGAVVFIGLLITSICTLRYKKN